MKKVLSVLLVFIMAFSALPAMAESGKAEEVLLVVKEKIEIPEELTEFSYSENKYDDVLRYDFVWHTEDYTKELYVSSDSRGRIVTYSYYEQLDYSSDRTLIGYTLSDAKPLAENTAKNMFPDYFTEGEDKLILNEDKTTSSYSGRYKSFSFTFDRHFGNNNVESNRVVVKVRATKDKMYVQSVSAVLDEDAYFNYPDFSVNRYWDSEYDYEEKFPIKLYYATDYSGKEPAVKLFYRIDKGYVQYATGEIITEEHFDRYAGVTEDSYTESAEGGVLMGKNEATLSPKEQSEIDKMESLIKPSEIEKTLRGLTLLKITEDMKFSESYTYKSEDKYFINFGLKGEERVVNVAYNGETGEITSIYSYFTKTKSSENKESETGTVPESDILAFAKTLSGTKTDETEVEFSTSDKRAAMNATRIVNGVPFPENSITVTYDTENNMVTRYSIYWDEDTSAFPKPEEAIGLEKAREIIFKNYNTNTVWLKQKEGYSLATTIESAVTIDAITGEELYKTTEVKAAYTDITSHWAKEAIEALWEHDIYLTGDKFNPDSAITQADMIRLFSSCRNSGIIPIGWEKDRISEYAVESGYVEAAEPDKLMTRKEAFETLVEILGYGVIADFDIYKSSYTDMEPCGSAEILKAMGVLVGDSARPLDNLTRAEAAVMVYRYLTK